MLDASYTDLQDQIKADVKPCGCHVENASSAAPCQFQPLRSRPFGLKRVLTRVLACDRSACMTQMTGILVHDIDEREFLRNAFP
jgi:hypothetical protein